MDNSEQYIKMCDCPEIQEQLNTNSLLLIGAPTDEHGIILGIRSHDIIGKVWLPRQDQLQEMLETTETLAELIVIDKLVHFSTWVRYQCHTPFTSMEQLWLAFIMKEKFNKAWDSEKEEWR